MTVALRIAVLLSGTGTSLEKARRHGLPAWAVDRRACADEAAFNDAVHRILDEARPDLLVLAGFLSRLELRGWDGRAINVHPALVPAFSGRGFYGERVHRSVLESGVKVTGATVHFCNQEYDQGPIILQEAVAVRDDDTVETLAARVLAVEHELLPRAIQLYAEGRLRVEGRRVRVLAPDGRDGNASR